MGRIRTTLTWLAAAGCLAWVLHDVTRRLLARACAGSVGTWVAAGMLFDVLGYVAQGWRWQLLLGGLSTRKATQAVYAGLFTNEVLPLRLGEGVRAWLARRWTGLNLKTIIGSMVIERLFDGVWLAGGIALASQWVELPPAWAEAGRWLALAAGFGAFALPCVAAPTPRGRSLRVSSLVLLTQALAFASIARAARFRCRCGKPGCAARCAGRHGHSQCSGQRRRLPVFTVLGLTDFGVAKAQATCLQCCRFRPAARFPFGWWAFSPSVPPDIA